MTHELSAEAHERAEAASELIRRYFGREVLHIVNGTYDNEDDEIERKNG